MRTLPACRIDGGPSIVAVSKLRDPNRSGLVALAKDPKGLLGGAPAQADGGCPLPLLSLGPDEYLLRVPGLHDLV